PIALARRTVSNVIGPGGSPTSRVPSMSKLTSTRAGLVDTPDISGSCTKQGYHRSHAGYESNVSGSSSVVSGDCSRYSVSGATLSPWDHEASAAIRDAAIANA